jgi:RNA polymerase sigma factor (sigma-70 family)
MNVERDDIPMSDPIPDEELMLRVRNDEVEALSTLFERYHVALFNFFYRLSGDATASEDLVQDVFYRLLKYRRSYKPGTPFRTWVYQVARNARNDRFRKQRDEVDLEAVPVATVLPVDRVDDEQQVLRLKYALMQLPEDKRELLFLTRFQGLKYEEVARLLQCEVGAVKVRVHRALQELKDHFHRHTLFRRPHRDLGG